MKKIQLSLDEKYKPRSFEEVVGQGSAKSTIRKWLHAGGVGERVWHLAGPTGTGKTTIAKLIAAYLNCQKPNVKNGYIAEICGSCRSCKIVFDASQFGTVFVDHSCASFGGTGDIEALTGGFAYRPLFNYRVYLLDEAHCLSMAGQNCLLKKLEQLPSQLVVCFCTDQPDKLIRPLATRGGHLSLKKLTDNEMKQHMVSVCKNEGYPEVASNDDWLDSIVKSSDGSLRDALKSLDRMIEDAKYQRANAVGR